MTGRDSRRAQVYAAERLVHGMFDRAGLAARADRRDVADAAARGTVRVGRLGTGVCRPGSGNGLRHKQFRERVASRRRDRARGHRSAEYRRRPDGSREIAIPASREGRWALRELVVLHEIAHHLDDSDGPAHGPGFVRTLIALVGLVLGPEAEFVYRVVFTDPEFCRWVTAAEADHSAG